MSWATSSMRETRLQRSVVIDFAVPMSMPDSVHNHCTALSTPINVLRNDEWKDKSDSVERGQIFEYCYHEQLAEIKRKIISAMDEVNSFAGIVIDVLWRDQDHTLCLQKVIKDFVVEGKHESATKIIEFSREIDQIPLLQWKESLLSEEFATLFDANINKSMTRRNKEPKKFVDNLKWVITRLDHYIQELNSIIISSGKIMAILKTEKLKRDANKLDWYFNDPCKHVKTTIETSKQWILDAKDDFETFNTQQRA